MKGGLTEDQFSFRLQHMAMGSLAGDVLLISNALIFPPFPRWYHGKLDRTIAEERLRQARNPGSYLIRESDRRPGSFVLSFLSMNSAVNHFRYGCLRPGCVCMYLWSVTYCLKCLTLPVMVWSPRLESCTVCCTVCSLSPSPFIGSDYTDTITPSYSSKLYFGETL